MKVGERVVDGRTYVAHQRSTPLPSGRTPLIHVRGPVEWARPFRASWDADALEWTEFPDVLPTSTAGRAARFDEFRSVANALAQDAGAA